MCKRTRRLAVVCCAHCWVRKSKVKVNRRTVKTSNEINEKKLSPFWYRAVCDRRKKCVPASQQSTKGSVVCVKWINREKTFIKKKTFPNLNLNDRHVNEAVKLSKLAFIGHTETGLWSFLSRRTYFLWYFYTCDVDKQAKIFFRFSLKVRRSQPHRVYLFNPLDKSTNK